MSQLRGKRVTLKLSSFIVESFKKIDVMTQVLYHRLLPMIYQKVQDKQSSTKVMSFVRVLDWGKDTVDLDVFEVRDRQEMVDTTHESTEAENLLMFVNWFDEQDRDELISDITNELCEVVMEGI